MDSSLPESASGTQENPNSFLVSLATLVRIIKWLAGLVTLTEEELEEAGIYLGRLGGE